MRYRVFDPISLADNPPLAERRDIARFVSGPLFFDRDIQGTAKKNSATATNTAAGYGAGAAQIGSSFIPGLEREAQNPQGFTPEQINNQLVQSQEAVGGATSGVTGQGNLTAARTRNAGGFARALDEAQRQRGRQLSSNAVGIQNASDRLGLERQSEAQKMLSGLYGTDVSGQLKAMGIADEDLNTALKAGQTGWLQNAEGILDTGANIAKAFKPGK